MGLFSKPASRKEVRAFGRGKASSAKAAEAYAKRAHDREGAKRAQKALRDAKMKRK